MSHWFSAQELAGLHDLPSSVAGILKRAERDQWESRPRSGRGGGREFLLTSLPAAAQTALKISIAKKAAAQVAVTAGAEKVCGEQDLAKYQRLNKNLQRDVDSKLELLDAARAFQRESGLPKGKAFAEFARLYKAEEITVAVWVREAQPACSRSRLYDWERTVDAGGITALAGDRGKGRRGTGAIDSQPDLASFITGMIVHNPQIKTTTLHKAISAEFSGRNTLPSERTLHRWVTTWKEENQQVFTAITNPDAWKNKYMTAQGSASEHVIALNQLWEFDSTPADLMLTDGRHSILGVIDVFSRRTIFVVMPTSDSKGVAKVIRRAILSWGVPETAKTDNGADYKSKWIKHVFRALGVNQEFCPPFQGWKKPHIERVFRTFSHDIAELLPGFIGHNVTERKAIEARNSFSDRLFKKDQLIEVKMSSAELQEFCDSWLQHEYHTRKHSQIKTSPNEKAASWAGHINTVKDERVLDVLLSELGGTRTVGKSGIKLNGGIYIHPQLAAHTGDQVTVFFDETDMGRIYVYDIDGEFVCIAEDPAITGVSRTEVALQAKEIQKRVVQERRRELKKATAAVKERDVAKQILEHRAAQARAEKVTPFPRPEKEHTSTGLSAAASAVKGDETNLPAWFKKPDAGESIAAPKQSAQVVKPDFNRGLNVPANMAARYQFWLTIEQKIQEGTATEEESKWATIWRQSNEFNAAKMLTEMRKATHQL
ncbi:MAG: hypothetical protein CMI13_04230 [Oleibacter sp.]|nr:hypothetical protein [Thalassolituus sp.]